MLLELLLEEELLLLELLLRLCSGGCTWECAVLLQPLQPPSTPCSATLTPSWVTPQSAR